MSIVDACTYLVSSLGGKINGGTVLTSILLLQRHVFAPCQITCGRMDDSVSQVTPPKKPERRKLRKRANHRVERALFWVADAETGACNVTGNDQGQPPKQSTIVDWRLSTSLAVACTPFCEIPSKSERPPVESFVRQQRKQ